MSESWDFPEISHFTVGAVGEPGHRLFYFQTFAAGTEVAVKCEKQQAQALADHLVKLLDDIADGGPTEVAPAESVPPAELAWTVGSISIGLDRAEDRLVVVFEEFLDIDDEDDTGDDPDASPPEPAQLRVRLRAHQVRAFAAQMSSLLAGSRPICRLCEHPIDPSGHACPRLN